MKVENQSSHVGAVRKQSDNIIWRHTPSVQIFMTGRSLDRFCGLVVSLPITLDVHVVAGFWVIATTAVSV